MNPPSPSESPKRIPPPPFRKLRGYAVDPSYSTKHSTINVNELVYQVPWEELDKRLGGGSYPVGEYLEIIDRDPASDRFYEPVNLDDPHLLAQDGHEPSVSNPQFHQQMVYAVMMTTIKNFELALGRKIQWADDILKPDKGQARTSKGGLVKFKFVQHLRVYPHALRQANAFYDPDKKAILFGYFSAAPANPQLQLPGSTVFTCLSHDIIAHETTHAILDGLHRRYKRATHPDTRAFHEAFADLIALFQHFSFPSVLKHQIGKTRGDLNKQNILGQLAQQFGQATGGYGSLRDAIGETDEKGNWKPKEPNPDDYQNEFGFHKRGGILVAAVFDAFLKIYKKKAQRILRIASGGTGVLPDGELHPDLVEELAKIASKTAESVLRICVRALDYCPPLDITFGDYLRAIITADFDMVENDEHGYRAAFVEAFQQRGIFAAGIRSMAIEELRYELRTESLAHQKRDLGIFLNFLRKVKEEIAYLKDREQIHRATKEFAEGKNGIHERIQYKFTREVTEEFADLTGLMFPGNKTATEKKGLEHGYGTDRKISNIASYVVGNVWLANRTTPDGGILNHLIVTVVQKRGVNFDDDGTTFEIDGKNPFFVPDAKDQSKRGENSIEFGGGCTLVFDLDNESLRYAIKKDIDDEARMIRQYEYQSGRMGPKNETYFTSQAMNNLSGPFACMHSHHNHEGEDGQR